jgi:hypothetical protein
MTRLTELLDDATGTIEPAFEFSDLTSRVRERRRRRTRRAIVASVVAVVLVAIAVRAATRDHNKVRVVAPVPPAAPHDVLVFNSTNGIMTVDETNRIVSVHPLGGWRPGDQPFLSLHVGNSFVVGWGDVHATPLSSRKSITLGRGVFVPAVEPGGVWLTSYGQVQTKTERLVDMQGHVLLEGRTPASVALTGAPGGLVLQDGEHGLAIWDARTGKITRRLGTRPAEVAPMHNSLLAWCDDCGRTLNLTDLATGRTTTVPMQLDGRGLDILRTGFSPDGTKFAGITVPNDFAAPSVTSSIVIVDVATGRVLRTLETHMRYPTVAWSPDSARLYVHGDHSVVHYDMTTFAAESFGDAPAGAGDLATVLTATDAAQLPPEPLRSAAACYPSATWIAPNGSGLACSYRF